MSDSFSPIKFNPYVGTPQSSVKIPYPAVVAGSAGELVPLVRSELVSTPAPVIQPVTDVSTKGAKMDLFSKILAIAMAGLKAVPVLSSEWGTGAHLQAISDGIQFAGALAAEVDPTIAPVATSAASSVSTMLQAIVSTINDVKATKK